MRLEHAKHNESLCDTIHTLGTYNDWVVTTAFYASLHYVHHKLFPLTEGTKTYQTFAKYYRANYKYPTQKSKHEVTKILVAHYLPTLNTQYRRLFEICHNARYTNYHVSDELAQEARNILTSIKLICDTSIATPISETPTETTGTTSSATV